MVKHHTRVIVICALAALSLIGLVVGAYIGADASVIASLGTAAGIFVPAAADALSVEKRRRQPGVTAIVDDVVQAVVEQAKQRQSDSSADSRTDSDVPTTN